MAASGQRSSSTNRRASCEHRPVLETTRTTFFTWSGLRKTRRMGTCCRWAKTSATSLHTSALLPSIPTLAGMRTRSASATFAVSSRMSGPPMTRLTLMPLPRPWVSNCSIDDRAEPCMNARSTSSTQDRKLWLKEKCGVGAKGSMGMTAINCAERAAAISNDITVADA
jgi:hypothetical protein